MATAIDPTDLPRHLATYGPRATVITVSGDARPHVGTSLVALDGDRVVLQVGPRAAGYLETHRDLCLTWAPPAGAAPCGNHRLGLPVICAWLSSRNQPSPRNCEASIACGSSSSTLASSRTRSVNFFPSGYR